MDSARGSSVQIYAQNMHEADDGAFTGEVSAPMLARDRRAGRDPRALRAPPVLQRDRPRAAAEGAQGARRGPDPDPVRRRDRGRARARRHRAQAAPPGPGGAREGRQGPAARGRDRVRADLGDRHGQDRHGRAGAGGGGVRARAGRGPGQGGRPGGADPLRRLAASPTTRPRSSRCRTSTARWSAARASRPTRSRGSSKPPGSERRADHPRRLGPRPGRSGERDLARRHAGVRRAVVQARAYAAHGQGRGGRPARGPDGQLRGRPPQPRRRRDRAAGPRAHRQGGRRTARWPTTRCCRRRSRTRRACT